MKYKNLNFNITQKERESANNNILNDIIGKGNNITKEQIFNAYTGKGKLHNLSLNEFNNFHEYTEEKKLIELGQFFTPFEKAKEIVSMLSVTKNDKIFDPMGGIGVFCNFINELNFTMCDIDKNNITIAKHLFPTANINHLDITLYNSNEKFDYIITNPAFNIKLDNGILSQDFILMKSKFWLKHNGIFAAIVPKKYLQDEMYFKKQISFINDNFHWLGQIELENNLFKNYDLKFDTKIIFFQNNDFEEKNLFSNKFNSFEEVKCNIEKSLIKKQKELLKGNKKEYVRHSFDYKCKKYLYEMSKHKELKDNVVKATILLNKLKNQVMPDGMKFSEWKKIRLTENKVLHHLKNYAKVTKPHKRGKKKTKLVDEKQLISFENILIEKKYQDFANEFSFVNMKGKLCKMYDSQNEQAVLHLHKQYSLLNMQMGTGKTAVAHCISDFRLKNNLVKKTIIVAPSIAIKTWKKHLKNNNIGYNELKNKFNLNELFFNSNQYILVSANLIGKRNNKANNKEKRFRRDFISLLRQHNNKIQLIYDESHGVKTRSSQTYKALREIFIKCKYKLLMTGTTVLNSLSELYPQFEFLYNNSNNMVNMSKYLYAYNEDNELIKKVNKFFGERFTYRNGFNNFKYCYAPEKSTVFGIKKQEQNLYNYDDLKRILSYTVTTKTFKEMCGDKYDIHHIEVEGTANEKYLQKKIVTEYERIKENYFNINNNFRKESAMRLLRIMQLLMRSCSMPQTFKEFKIKDNSKKDSIVKLINNKPNELFMIGCTQVKTGVIDYYYNEIKKTGRTVFKATGTNTLRKREKIIEEFQKTSDGVLICTQQAFSSSLNIPECDNFIFETMQWNLGKMYQSAFRIVRYDSVKKSNLYFITYKNSIENNLVGLLMAKERLALMGQGNDIDMYEIAEEMNIDLHGQMEQTISKEKDEFGKFKLNWGKQEMF